MVHPAFAGKDVPVRKKAPPSRKLEVIATHAAPGVDGHGKHGIHGPQPNPSNIFPLHPHTLLGEGRGNTTSGAGLWGSVITEINTYLQSWAVYFGRGYPRKAF
jgi:hypothetical protein